MALLLALADLMGFAHQAAEQHAVCAEHGELIHAGEAQDAVAPSGASSLTAPDPAGENHDGDDHCRLCPGTLERDAVVAASSDGLPPAVSLPTALPPTTAYHTGTSVLTHAPKTSPPTA